MHALLLAYVLLRGVDSGSTFGLLAHGARETNPLLPQRPALNLAVGTAITAGQVAIVHAIAQSHPKTAKWLLVVGMAAESYAVASNLRELRK